ncbi:MAG: cyclic nucleotide-binding domain-containing protein [Deltaproteobacteria bacterium]|nr:cyclic nucleotide-binding domain-containing protein [Deltaproteobacteria bacterium]
MTDSRQSICRRMKRNFQFFSFLNDQDIEVLSPFFHCRQAPAGSILWKEGDEEDYVAFIISGRIEVRKATEFKEKQVVVGLYGKGSIVGELCILNNVQRAVSAVVIEAADLLTLDREDLETIIRENPELGSKLLKGMLAAVSLRLRKSFDRLASIF